MFSDSLTNELIYLSKLTSRQDLRAEERAAGGLADEAKDEPHRRGHGHAQAARVHHLLQRRLRHERYARARVGPSGALHDVRVLAPCVVVDRAIKTKEGPSR